MDATTPPDLLNTRSAIAHIWLTVISNYSYEIYKRKNNFEIWVPAGLDCVNGEVRTFDKRGDAYSKTRLTIYRKLCLNVSEHFLVTLPNELYDLRFISCGRPPKTSLAFSELTNVFDIRVWLPIIVSVIVSVFYRNAIVGNGKSSFEKLAKDTIAYYNVLMEQGSAFSHNSEQSFSKIQLKLPCDMFLLGGIVLSNAYCNKNVYNMVKPLVPVPYEAFSQLIRDKFKIYTRNVIFRQNFSRVPSGRGEINETFVE